jgi:uncharacterized metal-binding protein
MKKKVMIFPCSGIGKVCGSIARDAAKYVIDSRESAEGPCLALLTTGDEETVAKVKENPSITIDGCPKTCAMKNVEKNSGSVIKNIMVMDYMKKYKELKPGTVTDTGVDGRKLSGLIAEDIIEIIKGLEA